MQDDAENVGGKIRFWFGEHTGHFGNAPNKNNVVTVTGNDSISTSGTIAVSVYDANTQQWSDYIDADQDTVVASTWGSYQWEDYGDGRILEFTQNDAFVALSSGTHVDQFKYRFTPEDTSLNAVEAEVTVNLVAINDPIDYTLDKAEWLYTSAGASTTVLANAANVGTTPEAAVLGDHSGGIGMAGSTKRDPDGDGSIHVYDYGYDQGWGFATPTESADGVLQMSVWKQNNNGYYSTRVYPDEDVTLTVTDSGD